MQEKVEEFLNSETAMMLFLHIREPEEIEKAKQAFDAKTVLIKRKSVKPITSNMADGNVFNYSYDILINNTGDLNDYRATAVRFIEDFTAGSLQSSY